VNTPALSSGTGGLGAWISLTLNAPTTVSSVAVYNRNDNYAYLLGAFTVWVSDTPASGAAGVSDGTARQCGSLVRSTATLGPFVATCSPVVVGSYVTVRQEADGSSRPSGYLVIGEIEVH